MSNHKNTPLRVHSFESLGTYDGPGLRLVVFTKGCNFRCLYCANVDTIPMDGGTEKEIEDIVKMAVSEKPFFGKKGGITFSGGEPMVQAKALIPLCKRLKEEGIHICLDTNGSIWNEDVEILLGYVDLVLLDIKQINPNRHLVITERQNGNTLRLAQWLEAHGHPFWVRYVLVPGYSDDEQDILQLAHFLEPMKMRQRLEILPYHTLGVHKYEGLGKSYKLADVKQNTAEQLNKAKQLFDMVLDNVVMN